MFQGKVHGIPENPSPFLRNCVSESTPIARENLTNSEKSEIEKFRKRVVTGNFDSGCAFTPRPYRLLF